MLLLTHEYKGPYLVHSSSANLTRKKGTPRLAALNGALVGEFAMCGIAGASNATVPELVTEPDPTAMLAPAPKRRSIRSLIRSLLSRWTKSDSEPHPYRRRRPF